MNEQKMIPWDVIIEILNKLQANNPGHTMERVNKYVNDEIYEWWYNQEPEIKATQEINKLHPSWNDPDT